LVHHMVLSEHVSFFNKANIVQALEKIPKNSKVIIDASMTKVLDHDVKEVIKDYLLHAKLKEIEVQTIGDIINQ
jgi:MFS superfamily sulfate permease-like transporter